jgi:serine phosphatase RsbU (regulator of sigma subunit)
VLLDHAGDVGVSLLGGPGVPARRLDDLGLDGPFPWNDVLRTGRPVTSPSSEDLYRSYPDLKAVLDLPTRGPVISLPLTAGGDGCGALTFGFEDPDAGCAVAILGEIALLAGHAAARATLFGSVHSAAETLQRAYLPARLAPLGGLSFSSRYLPAGEPVAVGGDWYDAISLPGPQVGIIIGDVAGHGLKAATVMASLRGALRAFATVEACPAAVLDRLNYFTCLFKPDAFATVFVAFFDPIGGRVRFANAGHPPALLVSGAGATTVLDGALGPPLGLPGASYVTGEAAFPVGASLIAYTDGLIERRNEPIDDRLAQLVSAASAGKGETSDDLCDRLVFELLAGDDLFDDAALLVATRHEWAG